MTIEPDTVYVTIDHYREMEANYRAACQHVIALEIAAAAALAEAPPQEVEERVITMIRERRERGRAKYETSMERSDLSRRQWLRHAQEEALDLAIYLQKIIDSEPA